MAIMRSWTLIYFQGMGDTPSAGVLVSGTSTYFWPSWHAKACSATPIVNV
jgi:hypothetical protein